jgi:hypothetical protein
MGRRADEHLEEGLLGYPASRRRKRGLTWAGRLAALVLVVAVAQGVWSARTRFEEESSSIFARMRARMDTDRLACVSSHHVGVLSKEWVLLKAGDRRLANPRVTGATGDPVRVVEEFTHCGAAQRHTVSRHSAVQVTYETPSFFGSVAGRKRVELFTGEAAFCAQHMQDVFRRRLPCE